MTKIQPMRDAFLAMLHTRMLSNANIMLLTADFGSPVLDKIFNDRSEQIINVGIAEQNLINVATGLSLEGYQIFCYAIAPFLTMRCYEQIRVNLALLSKVRELNVNLVGVGAGYSYVVSGPTHQCYEDLTIMRALPSMSIISTSDEVGAAEVVDYALANNGPKYVRFDAQALPILSYQDSIARGFRILEDGNDITILATGFTTHTALKIRTRLIETFDISVQVIDITRLDANVDLNPAIQGTSIITLEEGFEARGGLDAYIRSKLSTTKSILNIGVNADYEFALGSREQLHEKVGIGEHAIFEKINSWLDLSKC